MAHYALLNPDNIVVKVITGVDENELIDGQKPEDWYANFTGLQCVRTSYNHKIRKQYAGIGFSYDPLADVFIAPQPFPSWSLDQNYDWQAPEPMPNQGWWQWDELDRKWKEAKAIDPQS